MYVAEENAVCPCSLLTVVKCQGNDVLKKGGPLKGLHRRVEVVLVEEVDALQDSPLGVEQVPVISLAGKAVLSQVAVGARTGPPPTA